MGDTVNIVWFKRDLRLDDHAPFYFASQAGSIIPLYIFEPQLWQQTDSSRRHWHFIHDSLKDLHHQLLMHRGALILLRGEAVEVLSSLVARIGKCVLWSHEETGNHWTYQRDIAVEKWCYEQAITWYQFPSNGVVRRLKDRESWSKIRTSRIADKKIPLPTSVTFFQELESDPWPDDSNPIFGRFFTGSTERGGRKKGLSVLNSFLKFRARNYLSTISKPGAAHHFCSRLSAHITYGTLSIREVVQETEKRREALSDVESLDAKIFRRNLSAFLARLAWRCHFVQKLEQQPRIEKECMHLAFEGMRESCLRDDYFEAWKNGCTGYPLVDACMRSLIHNGWINFRMRAMLVSFASYHLWLDWRVTGPYLAQLFTDYEPGIHYSQLQMQSGVTGINTIRIYNPIKQSLDHDPHGVFIRQHLPELKKISDQYIFMPWLSLDQTICYPKPIVDHVAAVKYARQKLSECFQKSGFDEQAKKVYQKLGSRSRNSTRTRRSTKEKKESYQMELNFDSDE